MSKVRAEISMSLDGFVAGPDPTLEEPLGRNGEALHEWVVQTQAWREAHGLEGGETNEESDMVREGIASVGASVMGRKMFSGGAGDWESDPRSKGWWGDEPPFHTQVFVLTHHAREPEEMDGGTTFVFVTEGIQAAVEQARAAAGDRDVSIAGGASVIQQALSAGLVEELRMHVAPILLGGGTRLFGEGPPVRLEATRMFSTPRAAHFRFDVGS
ncbi:MAG TPA: dihydrofolate reductase family protein [Gaiellaceae bacterium]|nr:dihydrofolate reductase family protein [Gaiellaceae bacterium]